MIGIYKITSPSGKIYIGQTLNIDERWTKYEYLDCKKQPRLYRSFLKYGVESHIFHYIEECSEQDLNYWERHYQELYHTISKNGLNCKLTNTNSKSGRLSDETKLKISNSHKGKILSEKHIENLKNKKYQQSTIEKFRLRQLGTKMSDETKLKMSMSRKGKKHTEESKLKMSQSRIGIKFSEEHLKNLGLAKKGIKYSDEIKLKMKLSNKMAKRVLDTKTNIIYFSIPDAAKVFNLKSRTLTDHLTTNKHRNKTTLILLEDE